MNKSNKETNLIKKLLADQLDKKERKKLYYSNLIEKQILVLVCGFVQYVQSKNLIVGTTVHQ